MRTSWTTIGILIVVSLGGFFACQDERESEYHGNLLESPGGLTLVESEHRYGWGRSDCYTCHFPDNFHQDRADRESGIDMESIRDYVEATGPSSCVQCHGTNGVPVDK